MITSNLLDFAQALGFTAYVKRPTPIEGDWRLSGWEFPCLVLMPSPTAEYVRQTSGTTEVRDFDILDLRATDVTFDTAEADSECELARVELLQFVQRLSEMFHVEQRAGRQIWDSANGGLVVGWSVSLRLTELVGLSACDGLPIDPKTIEITENGTYNVLPFGRAVVDVQGGSPAVIEPLSVTPSRNAQTFSPSGFDGYAPVEVQGYDPVLQAKTATPATTAQVVTADGGFDGLSSVEVEAVTAAIDANIQPANIKKDVSILGVVGTMEGAPTGDEITIDNDGTEQTYTSATESTVAIAQNAFYTTTVLVGMKCNKVPNILGTAFAGCTAMRWFEGRSVYDVRGQVFNQCPLEYLIVGTLTGVGNTWIGNSASHDKVNLRKLEVGTGTAINLPLGRWVATNVIAEGQDAIDELNYNIKTYIADKVADRTNDTALTITFGASLYNVLTAATIAAFTAKNWNVASA